MNVKFIKQTKILSVFFILLILFFLLLFFIPALPSVNLKDSNLIAVVPHHDLVKEQRRQFFSFLSQNFNPQTIILISPNHFNVGAFLIISTKKRWVLKNGTSFLQPNEKIIDDVLRLKLIKEDSLVFDNEHGIKNLLPDIVDFFPKVRVVPIIINPALSVIQIERLVKAFESVCQNQCGVIVSVDMSHYQPALIAYIHDQKTIRALKNQDIDELSKVEVDCQSCLIFLSNWARLTNFNNFHIFNHTNSGFIANNFDIETTTHIFGYYLKKESQKLKPYTTFTIAGDMMLGRAIGFKFQKNNFYDLFSNLGNRTFWGTDISWINLEGPISDQVIPQDPKSKDLKFLFSKEALNALKFLKLKIVGLANNHTDDYGASALELTRKLLEENNIDWHGDPLEVSQYSVKRYNYGEIPISMIAVNTFGSIKSLSEIIKKEKQNGQFVIILPHWGNEYQLVHSTYQEKLARQWFKDGADLIFGTHPHVIQDAQLIDGKLVFYSLGNFVFDQLFSREVREGLIISGIIDSDQIKLVLSPIINNFYKPEFLRGQRKKQILDKICAPIQQLCQNEMIVLPRK